MTIKEYFYLLPLFIAYFILRATERTFGTGFLSNFIRYIRDFDFNSSLLIHILNFNYSYYTIPIIMILALVCVSVVISLILSMVPYLLADPKFDQRTQSPITASRKILKGSYLRLFLLRLMFIPWFLWIVIGFFISTLLFLFLVLSAGGDTFQAQIFARNFVVAYLVSVFVHHLFIRPLYLMVHAVLYSQLRVKLKENT